MVLLFCTPIIQMIAGLSNDGLPEELRRLEETRRSWSTGQVEWIWTNESRPVKTWNYTSRFGGESNVLILRGDDEGVISRGKDGHALSGGYGPHYSLYEQGRTWQYDDGTLRAEMVNAEQRAGQLPDLRSLGLSPQFPLSDPAETLSEAHGGLLAPRRYTKGRDGNLITIRGDCDRDVITWWIDPEAGGLPVRVVQEAGGEVLAETRCTVRDFNGVWYPESACFFRKGYQHGKQPEQVVRIHSVYVNEPDQPAAITPDDIGIDAGVFVEVYNSHREMQHFGTWDGLAVLELEEYERKFHAGEIRNGPKYERNAGLRAALPPNGGNSSQKPPDGPQADMNTLSPEQAPTIPHGPETLTNLSLKNRETEWERYTRRFIERYRLNDEQRQKALLILSDCEERAKAYVAKNRSALEELESRLASEPSPQQNQITLTNEQKRLLAPLSTIFETRLKPGLEKLPTRAQRRSAVEAEKRLPAAATKER
ncbi:MAG: hypothetical protein HZB38_12985 [Planctomycetes bacterium]|nr:hypothetical protein [Planctomycetota bacterium]